LTELEDNKFSWLQRNETNTDVEGVGIDIALSYDLAVALDKEGLMSGLVLSRSLAEEFVHESAHI
jgi:hypothetical protein